MVLASRPLQEDRAGERGRTSRPRAWRRAASEDGPVLLGFAIASDERCGPHRVNPHPHGPHFGTGDARTSHVARLSAGRLVHRTTETRDPARGRAMQGLGPPLLLCVLVGPAVGLQQRARPVLGLSVGLVAQAWAMFLGECRVRAFAQRSHWSTSPCNAAAVFGSASLASRRFAQLSARPFPTRAIARSNMSMSGLGGGVAPRPWLSRRGRYIEEVLATEAGGAQLRRSVARPLATPPAQVSVAIATLSVRLPLAHPRGRLSLSLWCVRAGFACRPPRLLGALSRYGVLWSRLPRRRAHASDLGFFAVVRRRVVCLHRRPIKGFVSIAGQSGGGHSNISPNMVAQRSDSDSASCPWLSLRRESRLQVSRADVVALR